MLITGYIRKRVGILSACLCLVSVSEGQSTDHFPIDETPIVEFLAQRGTRSLVVGIVDGKSQYYKGFGTMNRYGKQRVAPDSNTLFEIGSITKVFTSLLLVTLQHEGVVHIDSAVAGYMRPESVLDPQLNSITLKHLATHTSGLPRVTPRSVRPAMTIDLLTLRPGRNPYRWYGASSLYRDMRSVTFAHAINTQFAYSNIGVGLLGYALSEAANVPFSQAIRQYITDPLTMTDTYVVVPKHEEHRVAPGHNKRGRRVPRWEFGEGMQGAGAMVSSLQDMMKFLRINLSNDETTMAELLDRCHQPCQATTVPNTQVGLGWFQTKTVMGRTIIWHNGGTGGFSTFIGFDKGANVGIVILANSTHDVDKLAFTLLQTLSPNHEEL